MIEDLSRGLLVHGGRRRGFEKLSMDVGYWGELASFFQNVQEVISYDNFFKQHYVCAGHPQGGLGL
jgi:hypothetical protein